MKTATIHVNKTSEKPEGVPVEIVQPEGELDERLLTFTLRQMLETGRREEKLSFELPSSYQVQHQQDGSFVVAGFGGAEGGGDQQDAYYQPPRPLAVIGLRAIGKQFDMIHAAIDADKLRQQQQQQQQAKPD